MALPRRIVSAAALVALGACTQTAAPTPPVSGLPAEPGEPTRVSMLQGDPAAIRDGLELVGAQCWLDGELRAANMLVDRTTGDVTFFDDHGKMLVIDLVASGENMTQVRMIGRSIDAPGRYERMRSSLERTVAGGTAVC